MKRSTDRILTTHTGSLPRPPELLAILLSGDEATADGDEVHARVRTAVREVVQQQVPVQVTRTRLQDSQKLWLSGVMKPSLPPVSATRT